MVCWVFNTISNKMFFIANIDIEWDLNWGSLVSEIWLHTLGFEHAGW